ncbi:MAG: hypothetical protein ACI85K_002644 [Hyphomicrobiaceae bacterium]|jgi:hypothetical protein
MPFTESGRRNRSTGKNAPVASEASMTRWGSTATSGGGLAFGDPTIITYSFVPDGTNGPAAVGSTAGTKSDVWHVQHRLPK